jgi:uncharacterized protein YfiM (DUF2279 family)
VYFVPAFVGLGAPHWDAEARGTIVGLTRGSGRAHLVRAALEAMAYARTTCCAPWSRTPASSPTELGVDGGASLNDWLMQFQADVIGLPVRRPAMVETTALGAAGLAGIATGVWRDAEHFLGERPEPTVFEPRTARVTSEDWLPGDKVQHFWVSYAVTAFGFAGLTAAGAEPDDALRVAVPVAAVAGIGKEVHDRRRGGPFSFGDLVADALGVASAWFLLREVR